MGPPEDRVPFVPPSTQYDSRPPTRVTPRWSQTFGYCSSLPRHGDDGRGTRPQRRPTRGTRGGEGGVFR